MSYPLPLKVEVKGVTDLTLTKLQVKLKISLEQATKVQRGSTGIAVLFL
jgi:hypothetical protein